MDSMCQVCAVQQDSSVRGGASYAQPFYAKDGSLLSERREAGYPVSCR
jgi:hypothetical protein